MAIRIETSKRTGIENFPSAEMSREERLLARKLIKAHSTAVPRTPLSCSYNCHGLTFGSRRAWIVKRSCVNTIISDDEYKEIPLANAFPGDVLIYYNNGDLSHSGVVVERQALGILRIVSKWGKAGEFVHSMFDCPAIYGRDVKAFRCLR